MDWPGAVLAYRAPIQIIGPRGATINQLQSTTLCKIQCQPGQPGGFARVKISGRRAHPCWSAYIAVLLATQTCVDGAVTYVQAMVGNWDDYTDEQLMQAGGKETRKVVESAVLAVILLCRRSLYPTSTWAVLSALKGLLSKLSRPTPGLSYKLVSPCELIIIIIITIECRASL